MEPTKSSFFLDMFFVAILLLYDCEQKHFLKKLKLNLFCVISFGILYVCSQMLILEEHPTLKSLHSSLNKCPVCCGNPAFGYLVAKSGSPWLTLFSISNIHTVAHHVCTGHMYTLAICIHFAPYTMFTVWPNLHR